MQQEHWFGWGKMALAICVFITWCLIIVLSLMPKKLSQLDMVFLYFVNTIFELSIFTVLHLNFGWITVDRSVEKSFADLVLRLINIPILLIISSNILLYSWKFLKWFLIAVIVLSCIPTEFLLKWLGIIKTPHWNGFYSEILFSVYILFSGLMTWFIVRVDEKEVKT